MKKILLILLVLCAATTVVAQNEQVSSKYAVRYVKEHLYYQKGDEMNVVDVDMEWPEVIDGQQVEPLKRWITTMLFHTPEADFCKAYRQFKAQYGSPVTALARIPDDNKYCYVDCQLRLLGHRVGRYVSYFLSLTSKPGKESSQQEENHKCLITYDLQHGIVMQRDEMIDRDMLKVDFKDPEELGDFMTNLIANSDDPIPDRVDTLTLDNVCLLDDAMLLQGHWTRDGLSADYHTVIPQKWMLSSADVNVLYTTSAARKLMRSKALKQKQLEKMQPHSFSLPEAADGQPIYTSCDTLPHYQGGQEAMLAFLSKNMVYPMEEGKKPETGKCMVSFVVESDGTISNICIIESISPLIDREAVHALRVMPRWMPGRQDGKPVNVRLKLPLLFDVY